MANNEILHFELRSGRIDTLLFVVKTADIKVLQSALARRMASSPDFFGNDGVAIDVRALNDQPEISLRALTDLLSSFRMRPLGIIGRPTQRAAIEADGLALLASPDRRVASSARAAVTAEVAAEATAAPTAPPPSPRPATTLIERPLRSGQRIYARGDLIVLDVVSHGAEIIAEGHIHVYAPLRGRAVAGASGNIDARILCTCMEPELICIAGIYRTAEQSLPDDLIGKPAQVRLAGGKLLVEALALK